MKRPDQVLSEPVIDWEVPPVLGKDFELSLDIEDQGRGIRGIQIWFKQAGNEYSVHSKEHPMAPPWRKGPSSEQVVITAGDLGKEVSLEEATEAIKETEKGIDKFKKSLQRAA